jgi:uncharacterized membrane protein HdeD (DUF308 family)
MGWRCSQTIKIIKGGKNMTATTAEQAEGTQVPWWLVLIEGIALIILGLLLLANPAKTSVIVIQVLGIYWLIVGIIKIVSIFIDSSMWGWKLFAGIVGILAGILILQHPLYAPLLVGAALVIILGIQGLIMGIVGLIQAFQGAGWGVGILGVVSILIGILLLANLWLFTFSLPWVIGILAIVGGIIAIIAAFRVK